MKQSTMFDFLHAKELAPNTAFVDLFCGIGGFSCGATMAGHRAVMAVDANAELLMCHKKNHPTCKHIQRRLPADDLPFPKELKNWHLHGSPPCTNLSIMRKSRPIDEREVDSSLELVRWFLKTALASTASSWSMEQVANNRVVTDLNALKKKHPLKVDWVVVDASNYDVPQHRKRLVAGSPFLISKIRFFQKKRKFCVRDALPNAPTEYIRGGLYKRPDQKTGKLVTVLPKDTVRPIFKASYTVCASGHLTWADVNGNRLRPLTCRERAALQTFPTNYTLPPKTRVALIGIGNAVPPRLAEILMATPAGWSGGRHNPTFCYVK